MKFLVIGTNVVFSRHELGFISALNMLGEVDVIVLSDELSIEVKRVGSDNGVWNVLFYRIPSCSFIEITQCRKLLSKIINIEDYDIIFTTPRLPPLLAHSFKVSNKTILRLWSIRAAKLRDNLRFGAYEDIAIFMPSLIANMFYITYSTYAIAVDYYTYAFARKQYPIFKNKLTKIYPPYGFIIEKSGSDVFYKIYEVIDKGEYVLGFTTLTGPLTQQKFEARPHAIILYQIAKSMPNINVILAGSTYEDWKHAFPQLKPLKNLYIIGRGFKDDVIAELYKKAKLVIVPISNRSISNRLLEALFYGKPIITSEIVQYLHPELRHGEHVYVSSWDRIVMDSIKVLNDDYILENLAHGAQKAYNKYFSTLTNIRTISKIIDTLITHEHGTYV